MSMIQGIDHISMIVPDVDQAVHFYCDGLGLLLKRRDDYNAIVATPDGVIMEICPEGTKEWDNSGITHICLNTFDVDLTFRRALEYGAVISRPEDPEPYTYQDLRMAFVRTPSGEEIEFWYIQKNGVMREPVINGNYIKNFVHVALTVPDMKACIRFYEELGAKLKEDWEWGCSIQLNDMRELELFTGGEYAVQPNAYTHYSLLTEDVDAAARKVVELGGRITHEPYDWSNLRICFCQGIAGEVIEFFQMYTDGRAADVFDRIPDRLPDLFQ